MKSLKFLQKPEVLYLLIGLAVVIILAVVYFSSKKSNEGFFAPTYDIIGAENYAAAAAADNGLAPNASNVDVMGSALGGISDTGKYPLGNDRIVFGDMAMRRYNDFADTQDMEKVGVIPEMEEGDKMLNRLLDTPSYEPDARNLSTGPTQNLNYYNERKYRAPPQVPILLQRIKMCERVSDWDCTKLTDANFAQYCGICSENGQDHLGAKHIGGLYIDPQDRANTLSSAQSNGTEPLYQPTFGSCGGKFMLDRPMCNLEKDRDDCKNASSLSDATTASKCGFCASTNNFVYVGSRGDKSTNYALSGNPVKHTVRLKLGISDPANAVITITRVADGSKIVGAYSRAAPNVYMVDIPNTFENEQFSIKVKYPDWQDYQFTSDDKDRIKRLSAPPTAPLVRAAYGPNIDDYTADDPTSKDVTSYVQSKFKVMDCSNTSVMASNDALGGDPAPGMSKQLRMIYSNDGTNFAYAYATEGRVTKPIIDDNYRALCPVAISVEDATKQVCEVVPGGTTTPTGRAYTTQFGQYYGATGNSQCLSPAPKIPRGIVGTWDSTQNTSRTVSLDVSVLELNGLATKVDALPKYGTIAGSKQFSASAPAKKLNTLPPYLFWFWGTDSTATSCTLLVSVPAMLRDPTVRDDLKLCPSGPMSTTPEGSKRLQAGVCEKFVNGKPQEPGTYSDDCVRSLFIDGGCTAGGDAYPRSAKQLDAVRKDARGNYLDADGIVAKVKNEIYNPASSGLNDIGQQLDIDTYAKTNKDCFGVFISNVCDTPFKETGPLTPACLDYLFKNAGKDNPTVGSTYPNVYNRSSGTDRTAWTPIMYCQRTGTMSPIDAKGNLNMEAIQMANSKGGVVAVRDFYRQIHYDANFNMDRNQQQQNLQKCYGVNVVDAAKPCPPQAPRLQDIGPPNAGSVQNPNLVPNLGGPSWGQGLVSPTLLPDNITVGQTYTVGNTPKITFKTVYAGKYVNNASYYLGYIVKYTDGNSYMNLAWPDKRGPAYSGSYMSPPGPNAKVWVKVPTPPPSDEVLSGKVILYTQCNYGGRATALPIGDYTLGNLQSMGHDNDTCRSIKIPDGLKITMYQHGDYQGWEYTLTDSNPCLEGQYKDNLSSCRVSVA
jgi:hypothetical protein